MIRSILLSIGVVFSVGLSLYLGYREGLSDGFTYTEKVDDFEHATGLLRSANDQALESFAWYEKLSQATTLEDVRELAEREREYSLYNIKEFKVQARRIKEANINYPLIEIYEPQIRKMETKLSK